MVRQIPEFLINHHQYHHLSAPLAAISLFLAITALLTLCAHHNHKTSSKLKTTTATPASKPNHLQSHNDNTVNYNHINTSVTAITNEQQAKFPENTITSPLRSALMSPLRSMKSPKRFFTVLTDKATTTLFSTADHNTMPRTGTHNMVRRASHYDKRLEAAFYDGFTSDDEEEEDELKGNEDKAVWQKNILMGDKCRPLDYSGVIYYDDCGNKVAQIPARLPRAAVATPSPQRSFTFPGSKDFV